MSRGPVSSSAQASLTAVVLGLEAALMFFVTLVVFGLRALPPTVAFTGGGIAIVLFVLAAALVRRPGGIWVGGVLQVALIATGLLLPLMYVIGAGFAAMYIYYVVKGRQIDRRNAEIAAATGQGEQ